MVMHMRTLNEMKENVISSTYFRSLMAHANMFMPRYGTNRLVYETEEIKMAISVPSKAVCREIGPALWKIGLTDFVKMSEKDAFSW